MRVCWLVVDLSAPVSRGTFPAPMSAPYPLDIARGTLQEVVHFDGIFLHHAEGPSVPLLWLHQRDSGIFLHHGRRALPWLHT